MVTWKTVLYPLLTASCLALSVVSLYNVYSDNSEVEAYAKDLACPPGKACQLAKLDRNPFGESLEYRTEKAAISVRCVRTALLFGAYECKKLP